MAETAQKTHSGIARVVLYIASTYVYFLIFAQFGFLKRLNELQIGQASLTPVMAAMALGGIASSLFAQHLLRKITPEARLRTGFVGCAVTAILSLLPLTAWSAGLLAAAIGLSLGLLTVTLVAHLRGWMRSNNPLFTVGLGTGLGYFFCNIPWLFAGSTTRTAVVSAAGCTLAALFVRAPYPSRTNDFAPTASGNILPFPSVLLSFFALIWLDSAAFYIIQNSPALKAGTWQGTIHLWTNAGIHLIAALVSAWLLQRRGLQGVLLVAFCFIGGAGLLLHIPSQTFFGSILYPAGVSLYSVALVAYPSLLLVSPSVADRERRAGLIYAIAGWWGSAMGIGMGQHLHRVPTPFVAVAGLAIVASTARRFFLRNKAPSAAALGMIGLAALLQRHVPQPQRSPAAAESADARGRQVYIAEGCINCHSQYVRPRNPDDVTMWGPGSDVEAVRRQTPPLIGNRRQGPDLSEVGGRRSPLWLRMHFINPRDVSPRSIMPSYRYLFEDGRGDDLLAYIESLRSPDQVPHLHGLIAAWHPAPSATAHGPADGSMLFDDYCATCHLESGKARQKWGNVFQPLPPDLFTAPLPRIGAASSSAQALLLERMIKFGIPGSNMPGHECLPDAQITTLARWILQMRDGRKS